MAPNMLISQQDEVWVMADVFESDFAPIHRL